MRTSRRSPASPCSPLAVAAAVARARRRRRCAPQVAPCSTGAACADRARTADVHGRDAARRRRGDAHADALRPAASARRARRRLHALAGPGLRRLADVRRPGVTGFVFAKRVADAAPRRAAYRAVDHASAGCDARAARRCAARRARRRVCKQPDLRPDLRVERASTPSPGRRPGTATYTRRRVATRAAATPAPFAVALDGRRRRRRPGRSTGRWPPARRSTRDLRGARAARRARR